MTTNPTESRQQSGAKLVRDAVLDEATFIKLSLGSRRLRGPDPWERVSVRPVMVGRGRMLQFTYFGGGKCVTRNFSGQDAGAQLDETLAMSFSQMNVQSTNGELHVRVTRRGDVMVTRTDAAQAGAGPDLSHDRVKAYPLEPGGSDHFLQALGIAGTDGKVLGSMQGKFRQINEFLRIVARVCGGGAAPGREQAPLEILDCGCGAAYLTFAAYHYLNFKVKRPAKVVGIDSNPEIIRKCADLRTSLGWDGLEFHASAICDYTPKAPPHTVLSLHACDTATDEAIAGGIAWGARVILAAPCCQHELHGQLKADALRALTRHGILRERLADIVTDAFRALVLRIMGYRTEVVEFVSPEHTSKNLLIRAVKGASMGDAQFVQEYVRLKEFWQVTPFIERLLGDSLGKHLPPPPAEAPRV